MGVSYERGTPVGQQSPEVSFSVLYRGTLLIRRGHSETGRWHVLLFKNVLEKRSVHVLKK